MLCAICSHHNIKEDCTVYLRCDGDDWEWVWDGRGEERRECDDDTI